MKREFRKRVEVPDPNDVLAGGGRLPRAAAVALIAARISDNSPGDDERSKRQRVQSAMRDGIRKHKLGKPDVTGFGLAEIAEWARKRFPKDRARFEGLPRALRALRMHAEGGRFSFTGFDLPPPPIGLPTTVEDCHARILENDAEIVRLTEVECELRREIAELEPDAHRWREFKRKCGRRKPC